MSTSAMSSSSVDHDSGSSDSSKPVHLVILIHGLFGSSANVATVAEELYHIHRGSSSRASASPGDLSTTDSIKDGKEDAEGGVLEEETENGGMRYREDQETPIEADTGSGEAGGTASLGSDGEGRREEELVVYSCNSFGFGHTWDGIDINAQRAAKEVSVTSFCEEISSGGGSHRIG